MSSSHRRISKKLINSPETCVDDNLRGIVATYPKLRLHPAHRLITVQPKKDTGRVAILGGGGSGHEPFAGGLVGSGMLDGAVAGSVFTAPPTGDILYAIAYLYKYYSGGVLTVLGNYTGDRLNFGKAIEKAKISGIKVEGLIVGEDVASSHNKTGGRSMCGEVFVQKLCGAMSCEGYDISTIKKMAAEASMNMATLGVCLSPCSLPGQLPLFEIADDEMELGVGVHGEAGITKMRIGTAAEVVRMIIDKIIENLKINSGERVVAMCSNLGSTSGLEMNIICGETKDYLRKQNIKTARLYSVTMKTSLEMHGIQICLFRLNQDYGDLFLKLLDYPTEVAIWTGTSLNVGDEECIEDDDSVLDCQVRKTASGPRLQEPEQILLRECLMAASKAIEANERLLNQLDSGCGDGDTGHTMKTFANEIINYLKTASVEYPSNLLWDLSELADREIGGTTGGIYSLGLSAASQAIAGCKSLDPTSWVLACESAINSISTYGGAEPGDRTMLDTLHATLEEMKKPFVNINDLIQRTILAADRGAKATRDMVAGAGRASYVSGEYLKEEDAGARATAIWIAAILETIKLKY